MHRTVQLIGAASLAVCAFTAAPAWAEVTEAHDDHFVTRAEAVVDASRTETWLALISPARWWDSSHTWSADAANLRLRPQAGGCFCETIPETDTPNGGFTLEGSVEHMRVIQAYPEVALRMSGALGPLQSEPVSGILTIAMSDVEPADDGSPRTRLVWEYNVGGKMRYPVPVISNAVDGVMTLQLTRLAELLGPIELPSTQEAEAPAEPSEDGEPAEAGAQEGTLEDEAEEAIDVEDVASETTGLSVDEAFDDLNGEDQGDEDLRGEGASDDAGPESSTDLRA